MTEPVHPSDPALEAAVAEFAAILDDAGPTDPDEFCRAHAEGGPDLRARIEQVLFVYGGLGRRAPAEGRAADSLETGIRAAFGRTSAARPDSDESLSAVPAARPPAAGETFGDFRIVRELGRGGMGVVFLAEQLSLHRWVALKVLTPLLGPASPERLARFRREAEAASRLDHPGICTVFETGEMGGAPYIAMRYVEGETLASRIARVREENGSGAGQAPGSATGPSTREEIRGAVHLVERVARALHVAHEAGLVHRDVKPGNIMVTPDGDPVILDFGLARDETGDTLTQSRDVLGTPAYMAPEQLRTSGAPPDRRTDLYALGVTLYECLTLRRPFEAATAEALYQRILSSDPSSPRRLNPHIPRDLEVVLDTALDRDRARRYKTALDFAEDLRHVRSLEPIRARPAGRVLRLWRWAQRRPALAASLASVILLLSVGLGVSLVLLAQSNRALRRARALGLANAAGAVLKSDPMLALLLAREAVRIQELPETLSRLQEAVGATREKALLRGHEDIVHTVTFSPRGDMILTASRDGTTRLWDLRGKELRVLRGHTDRLVSAGFSPAGDRILTASWDGTAKVWDLEGREVTTLRGHDRAVNSAVFSPGGDRILTASADATARVWDLQGNRHVILEGHSAAVSSARFSPAGDRIVTVSADGTARLWDPAGKPLVVLRDPDDRVRSARFSPGGDRVATAGGVAARLWDLDGCLLASFQGHSADVMSAVFSPGGDRILTLSRDATARLWDLQGKPQADFWTRELAFCVTFSPDGSTVLLGCQGGTVRLFDLSGKELEALLGHKHSVYSAAFSPDGKLVLTGSLDGTARIWGSGPTDLSILRAHRSSANIVRFSPKGDRFVTCSHDRSARVWNLEGKLLAILQDHPNEVMFGDPSPAGDRALTACRDGFLRLWDLSGALIWARPISRPWQWFSAVYSPAGDRILMAGPDGSAHLLDPEGNEIRAFGGHGLCSGAAFSASGDRIVTCGTDNVARVWDLAGNLIVELRGHTKRLAWAALSPSGKLAATCSDDSTARVWDLSGGTLAILRHSAWVEGVAFSPDGSQVATSSGDGTAKVWDLKGREIFSLRGHEGFIPWVTYTTSGDRVVTVAPDGTVRFWPARVEDLVKLADRCATRDFTAEERTQHASLLSEGAAAPR